MANRRTGRFHKDSQQIPLPQWFPQMLHYLEMRAPCRAHSQETTWISGNNRLDKFQIERCYRVEIKVELEWQLERELEGEFINMVPIIGR